MLSSILGNRYASFIRFANLAAFPPVGSFSVIYLNVENNLLYQWNGTEYIQFIQFQSVDYYDDLPLPPSNYYGQIWEVLNDSSGHDAGFYSSNGITWNPFGVFKQSFFATSPLSYDSVTGTFSISQANTTTSGYISSTDWNTFNNKQPLIATGTTSQYWRGDKTFQTLDTSVVPENGNLYYTTTRFNTDFATKTTTNLTEGSNLYFTNARTLASILTGYSVGSNIAIDLTDSVLQAFGKTQGQINALISSGSNYLIKTNNLSDLENTLIARRNLGIKLKPLTLTSSDYIIGFDDNVETGYAVTAADNYIIYLPLNAQSSNGDKITIQNIGSSIFSVYDQVSGGTFIKEIAPGQMVDFYFNTSWQEAFNYESYLIAGSAAQYYRGDKTWQTLNQAAIAGLTTADSPTLTGLNLSGLSISQLVATNGSKNLVSANLTGDITSIGLATTITNQVVTYAKIQNISANNTLLGRYSSGAGSTQQIALGSGLTLNTSTGILTATGLGGTVTSVSVVSANGFAGSVATSTTTPAITISTTITGVIKGNGTALSVAGSSDIISTLGYTPENIVNKDASGGYVGLTLFKINFKNAANTFTSFFVNTNTAARTYTFQDRNGTIADDTDLALKANLASPTFTGVPAAPTASQGNNSTQLATTAYVDTGLATKQTTTLSSGNIWVGSASNLATSVVVFGDITINSSGATTIGSLKVVNSMIANSTIDLTTKVTGILPVGNGGIGIASGTSGGIPYFSSTSTIASSAALNNNAVILGGGAGASPKIDANNLFYNTTNGSFAVKTNGDNSAYNTVYFRVGPNSTDIAAYNPNLSSVVVTSKTNNGGSTLAAAEPVVTWMRQGVNSQAYANIADWKLSRSANVAFNANTLLSLGLAGGSGDTTTTQIMSWGNANGTLATIITGTLNISSTVTAPTFVGALTGNSSTASSAAILTTARTLTIGSTGKTFDGSANVSWTLTEIGAAARGANSDITALTGLTGAISAPSSITMATGGAFRTNTSSTNTALLQAYNTGSSSYTTFGTLTAGASPSFVLANSTIGNTNSAILKDNSFTLQSQFDSTAQVILNLNFIPTATTRSFAFPATGGTIMTGDNSTNVTNKTISGSNNTLSNIANSSLTNSTISGVALGSNLNNLTVGSNLQLDSGTTYNGSAAKTISIVTNPTFGNVNITNGLNVTNWITTDVLFVTTYSNFALATNVSNIFQYLKFNSLAYTGNRELSIDTGDADRTITLTGNPTLNDWFNQSVKSTASPTFAGLTVTNNFAVATTASAVNYLQATGSISLGAPSLSAQGANADISILLTPKGVGNVIFNGTGRLNDNALYIRGGSDNNHALVYGSSSFSIDGPALYGYAGGALGSSNGGFKTAISWNNSQQVRFPGIGSGFIKATSGLLAASPITTADLPSSSCITYPAIVKQDTFSTTSTLASGGALVTGLSITITPRNANSKFLIFAQVTVGTSSPHGFVGAWIANGTTPIKVGTPSGSRLGVSSREYYNNADVNITIPILTMSEPATTSPVTFNVYVCNEASGIVTYVNRTALDTNNNSYGARSTSALIVIEILG